jgi:hypothetical protein
VLLAARRHGGLEALEQFVHDRSERALPPGPDRRNAIDSN